MDAITFTIRDEEYDTLGNWATAKDLFPNITVDQTTSEVSIEYYSINNQRRGQWGLTHEHAEILSQDGQVLRVTGMCGLRNDKRRTGGRQQFCFFVFRGDSGHLYTHRATASKGWLECKPEKLLSRLRKVGMGHTDAGVLQQGDFLLRPANGAALPEEQFLHEMRGVGNHNFDVPVRYAYDGTHRQILLTEEVRLVHRALDGIQHPDVLVSPGCWIIGNTSVGLRHDNRRD